jgi:hypothetical protein
MHYGFKDFISFGFEIGPSKQISAILSKIKVSDQPAVTIMKPQSVQRVSETESDSTVTVSDEVDRALVD